ncbi:glycosyltransferase [Paenibacillus pseudetheri]|uniref:Glycosyltransferase subfamily 4-like N-terminal domain-containing protein n=1 Tax=Paenibacillus pseudetheri TaxID=2897682 RepID=A0ABM9BHX9_9BACL|nr:glycosyltransferase [Paenibacillus pseudetheri]CAH1057996.1 hypothetical protein PAECIP111894_04169 [Paenibacillus pseudetheri]
MDRKVLLISHNALGKENNMARTLENQFMGLRSEQIAQLFFSDENPNSEYCDNYFRVSDSEVLRSLYSRKEVGNKINITFHESIDNKDEWIKTKIRKKGNRRPAVYLIRNLIWLLGKWKSKKLDDWLDQFKPDVIYFASGDYAFSYMVTLYIAKRRNIPVIIGCYDDFYIDKRKTINPLYHITYQNLMKKAKELFDLSSAFVAVSDMMVEDYSKLFNKKGYTLYTPTNLLNNSSNFKKQEIITYAGNLGHGRAEQLISLGRALKKIGVPSLDHIDVYSGEIRTEITGSLTADNGINFCGRVPAEKVQELMISSKYIVHTESFDETFTKRVKYSLSTKIADCLASGSCIIAYGPKEVASISYLEKDEAACVISDEASLEKKLIGLFASDEEKKRICASAKKLAYRNHSSDKNRELLCNIIESLF